IAAKARTSKRTVYQHFGDKEGLFRAVIRSTIGPMQRSLQEQIAVVADADARASLRTLVRGLATIVVTPQVVRLRRIVIAEADRFPDLAAEWHDLGPEQTVGRIEEYLAALTRLGALRIDDTRVAAEHLLWLTISTPLNRLMFAPSGTSVSHAELERVADASFEAFWRAYGEPGRDA
ncbi:MAG: TetR/AcrR family transcriptional regulator, partial [Thermomicrobiales bacterium]|nr:TetR/AcrR family transcriptional regulator [Thermomicrobiales bacterium]